MKKHKVFWMIAGIVLIAAGIVLLDVHVVLGIVSFVAGIAVLMLASISWMRFSGGVKDSYFYHDGGPSEKFSPEHKPTEENMNVWDQISGQNGDEK